MSMIIIIYFGIVLILAMTYLISLKPSKLKKRLEAMARVIRPLTKMFPSKKVQKAVE